MNSAAITAPNADRTHEACCDDTVTCPVCGDAGGHYEDGRWFLDGCDCDATPVCSCCGDEVAAANTNDTEDN